MESEEEGDPLCLSCLEVVHEDQLLCGKCGCPQDFLAATVPYVRVFAEGYILRKAVNQPRRLATVFGIWILFGLMVLNGLFAIVLLVDSYAYHLPIERMMSLTISAGSVFIGARGIVMCTSNFNQWNDGNLDA